MWPRPLTASEPGYTLCGTSDLTGCLGSPKFYFSAKPVRRTNNWGKRVGTLGPTTHITSLAHAHEYFCIQMVDPYLLRDALDASVDLRHERGETIAEDFTALLEKKYENCSEWFKSNLAVLGIQEPLVIIIMSDGRWWMDEGHHRLAWALLNHVEIPVIFDDTGADEESHMGWLVSRPNVSAYHYHAVDAAELADDVESAFAEVTLRLPPITAEVKPESVFMPSAPRAGSPRGGKHQAPGGVTL